MRASFYTVERIGPHQFLTPEGFLLCQEVPLARTGMMVYGSEETPIKAGPDGIVKIFRGQEEVFNPTTIASAQGKPVTNDHPDDDVRPETWKELTHGIMMNVRRGEGAVDDLLIGDLLVTTPEGIAAVQEGKREVSLGYEADYEEVGEGVGKQSNIIINHIALVEQGRCGPRCAISDSKPTTVKGNEMATKQAKKHGKIVDMMMRAFKAKDAEEVEKLAEQAVNDDVLDLPEGEGGDTHVHVHLNGEPVAKTGDMDEPVLDEGGDDLAAHIAKNDAEHAEMRARLDALEKAVSGVTADSEEEEAIKTNLKDEAPEGKEEEAVKAKDSAYLVDSFQDTVAMAEILAPGIRVPTMDRAASPVQSFKKICNLRRQALDLAYVQPDTRPLIDDLLAGKSLDTKNMTCDAVRSLFRSAAAAKRVANNSARGNVADLQSSQRPAGVKSIAELNAINAKHWNK